MESEDVESAPAHVKVLKSQPPQKIKKIQHTSKYFKNKSKSRAKMIWVTPNIFARIKFYKLTSGDECVQMNYEKQTVSKSTLNRYNAQTRSKRPKISDTIRLTVSKKQNFLCVMCKPKKRLPSTFDIDHIIPRCEGGKDDISNYQALCNNCHAFKSRTERSKPVVHGIADYFTKL